MYEPHILKSLMEEKSISSLIKLSPIKELIFQPKEYSNFFDLVNNYVSKYGEFPNNGYLDSFFETERTSDLNDVWTQIKDTNTMDSPTMAMVDLQVTHNMRSNVISITHATNVQLKSSNNSESNEIVKSLQTNINDLIHLSDRLNAKEETLDGTQSLANLKDHHNRTASEGYYISKYGHSLSFIDDIQGGLERAGFIGILASAKQRKSTLLRQIIYNQVISGKNSGLITLEMSLESIREHCIHFDSIITVKQFEDSQPIKVKIGEAKKYEGWLVDSPDGWVKINKWLDQGVKETLKIEMEDGGYLICTPDHKIETSNRGWVEAQYLTEDDNIITTVHSTSVVQITKDKITNVYDISVDHDNHRFYANGISVHNCILLHANNASIWGYSHPYISMAKVRSGGLTKEEKEFYYQVAEDLFTNPAYGKLHLIQPTGIYAFENMKLDLISMKARDILIVGIDYLSLIKPRDKGRIDMDDYNDMIMNTRYLALSLGQTYLTPIQANRDGYARALKMKDTPVYDINSIHLYSGFEKGCTSILSLIQTDQMRATNSIAIGSVVNREAPPFEPTLMTLHNDSGTFLIGQNLTGEETISILSEIDL